MKQVYLSNAVTNIHIRSDINGSKLKNSEIAEKFNISEHKKEMAEIFSHFHNAYKASSDVE